MSKTKPIVGITMGDAAGIGPEIIVKALSQSTVYEECRPLVIGDAKIIEKAVRITGASVKVNVVSEPAQAQFSHGTVDIIDLDLLPEDTAFGEVAAVVGDAAYQYLAKAYH